MASNNITNKTASIYIDDAPALQAYDRLSKKADDYNKKIDEGAKKAKFLQDAIQKSLDAGGKPEALQKKLSDVNKELDNTQKALGKVTTEQKTLQQQIDSKVGPSLKQQQALVNKLINEYKNLGANSKDAAAKLNEIGSASKTLQELKDRLNSVTNAQKEVGGGFGKIFTHVAEAFSAYEIISKATEFVKDFFKEAINGAMELERADARLKNTLSNLGQGEAFDRIKEKTESLTRQFQYLKDADVTTVFSKLITYGKLTEKQMNDLLPVIINFAAQQRIDLPEATDLVTKALEGNSKGLKTYGINLTETHTPAERLKVVMTELKSKVDGAGEAFQNTAAGGVAVAREQFNKAAEDLGKNLLPILAKATTFIADVIKGLRGITMAEEQEADNRNIQLQGLINEKAFKIQQQIKVKFINPKTGKPVTTEDYIKALEEELPKLDELHKKVNEGVIAALNPKSLGGGDANFDADAEREAARKRAESEKKALEEHQKFLEELHKVNVEYGVLNEDEFTKEIVKAQEHYRTLLQIAKEEYDNNVLAAGKNKEALKQADAKYAEEKVAAEKFLHNAVFQVQTEFSKKELDAQLKVDEEKLKRFEKLTAELIKLGEKRLHDIDAIVKDSQSSAAAYKKAEEDYEISKASGNKKFDLQKQQIERERQEAIQGVKDKGEALGEGEAVINGKIALANEEFDIKEAQLRKQRLEQQVQEYVGFANQIISIASSFAQLQTSKENAQLTKLQSRNDKEKAGYQRLLNQKLISTQQYNQKVAELDAAYDKKKQDVEKKQFERNKKIQIAQVLMNGAQAVSKAIAEYPFPASLVPIAFDVAETVAQVAVISKQQYTPSSSSSKFEKGGALTGPRHSDGGMPVINPRTGRKEAEVEGGEVILSRKTVSNNKPVVDALLYSSMHREGARIDPWFKNRTYKSIDFGGISRSIQNVRHYASGGTFQANASDTAQGGSQTQVLLPAGFEALPEILQAVAQRLSIPAKAYVVYQDIKDASDTIDSIKGDATFGKK